MRKILSVVLAVLMLAAMFVMPINAADELGLVITEINVDSSYVGKDGSFLRPGSNNDVFEFVEVYNASSKEINLYDYSFAYATKADATSFSKFTPIMAGNVCTSIANIKYDTAKYYPTNPSVASIKPGETAVIWFYTTEAYGVAAIGGTHKYGAYKAANTMPNKANKTDYIGGVPAEFFADYYGVDVDEFVFIAVDANGLVADETINLAGGTGNIISGNAKFGESAANYSPNSDAYKAERFASPNGVANAKGDNLAEKFPSTKGRFQLANKEGTLALVKTEKLTAEKALDSLTLADVESYASYTHEGVQDKTYNFTYNAGDKAGQLFAWNLATPGAILQGQNLALATVGAKPAANVEIAEIFSVSEALKNANTTYTTGTVLFEEDFTTAPAYNGKIENYSDNCVGSNATVANQNKRLYWGSEGVLKVSYPGHAWQPVYLELVSAEDMFAAHGENMMSSFVLSYDIQYHTPVAQYSSYKLTDGFAAVIFNYNRALSYDEFAVTAGGYGVSRNRYASEYTVADTGSKFFSGNQDTAGAPSIINRITNGKVLCAVGGNSSTVSEVQKAARMYDTFGNEWTHIDVYFNWETGTEAYVNGIKVSESTFNAYAEHALANGNFGLGIYGSNSVSASIDNIKMIYVDQADADNVDLLMSNLIDAAASGGMEPATGDATLYVVVAMAVAFVALAAVVIIRRKKATN